MTNNELKKYDNFDRKIDNLKILLYSFLAIFYLLDLFWLTFKFDEY